LDWSIPIARSLFGKSSKILVNSEAECADLFDQARANKALARILPNTEAGNSSIQEKLKDARRDQEERLKEGLKLLETTQKICMGMEIPYAVIKSLDALPDLGHDIDLLVGKNLAKVRDELLKRLRCYPVTLTFCDRQAGKFSTFIQGYDFDFELYARISQMGEEYYPEETVLQNRNFVSTINGGTYLCSNEDRLLITCIHTMYRHQKIRLSDLNIAYQAFKDGVNVQTILQTVELAGIQKGFAVFMTILKKTGLNSLGLDTLPDQIDTYTARVLKWDPLIARLVGRLRQTYPLKIPIGLSILLFLNKAATDAARNRRRSMIRSLAAPAVLVMDKSVPLKVQKATTLRIW
jgi:hypothetical protein